MRKLGEDPDTGLEVTVRSGRFGSYLQLGEATKDEDGKAVKPKRASLPKGVSPDDIDLDRALKLLSLPREVGKHPDDGEPIIAGIGRFGPYVKHGKTYANLEAGDDVLTIGLNRAVTLIAEKKHKPGKGRRFGADPGRPLGEHPQKGGPIVAKNGRYGPYVSHDGVNATLPSDKTPDTITLDEAVALIDARAERGRRHRARAASGPRARQAARQEGRRAQDRCQAAKRKPPPSRGQAPQRAAASKAKVARKSKARRSRVTLLASRPAQSLNSAIARHRQRAANARFSARNFIGHDIPRSNPPFPSKEEVLAFIGEQPGQGRHARDRPRLRPEERPPRRAQAHAARTGRRGPHRVPPKEAASSRHAALRHARRHHRPRRRRRIDRDPDRMGRGRARPGAENPHRHCRASRGRGEVAGVGDRALLRVEETGDDDDAVRYRRPRHQDHRQGQGARARHLPRAARRRRPAGADRQEAARPRARDPARRRPRTPRTAT